MTVNVTMIDKQALTTTFVAENQAEANERVDALLLRRTEDVRRYGTLTNYYIVHEYRSDLGQIDSYAVSEDGTCIEEC